jgi:hypothetical protein
MAACPVPPEEIRRRTLEKVARHEDRLFELLDAICFAEGRPRVPRSRWASWTGPYPTGKVAADEIRKRIDYARRALDDA